MTEIYEKKNAKRKGFSKYNDAFDYFDDDFSIAYSTIIKGKSISHFATVIGEPVRVVSASFCFSFSRTRRIIKKFLKARRKKEEAL